LESISYGAEDVACYRKRIGSPAETAFKKTEKKGIFGSYNLLRE
jgi:hypothetical protein